MPDPTKPSQQFVDIDQIKEGIVFLKNGGLRRILIVNGINFDLKSEAEQNLILSGFQNFLNTLDFSIQFFIHSRKTNVDLYLEKMGERKLQELNELLKIQIEEYVQFIKTFVEQNAIISKHFFCIVPYDPILLKNQARGFFNLLSRKSAQTQKQAVDSQKYENVQKLNHRVDQATNGLEQIGLRTVPLGDEELIELFYNLYNPQVIERKGLEIAKTTNKQIK